MNTVNKLHQIGPGIISVLVMSVHLHTALLGTKTLSHFVAYIFSLPSLSNPHPVPPSKKRKRVMLSSEAYICVSFCIPLGTIQRNSRTQVWDRWSSYSVSQVCSLTKLHHLAICNGFAFFFFFLICHFLASYLFSSESCCFYCKWPFRTLNTAIIMCLFV